jgi:hypothetical protein
MAPALRMPAALRKSRRERYRLSGVISEDGTAACMSLAFMKNPIRIYYIRIG